MLVRIRQDQDSIRTLRALRALRARHSRDQAGDRRPRHLVLGRGPSMFREPRTCQKQQALRQFWRIVCQKRWTACQNRPRSGCQPAKTGAGLTQGWDGTMGHEVSISHAEGPTLARPIVTTEQFAAWEEESNYGGW